MVDGFDTTIPLILQWFAGMLCLFAMAAVWCRRDGGFGRRLLPMWSVLSGLSQQASLRLPDGRRLQLFCCVPVPLRAGPPLTGSRGCLGHPCAGEFSPGLLTPAD